ncbi:hypothetical protein MANES_07G044715v8 [Manihot esculenta]|uniref:Uncharacterized protein n=1 Tax=Manihot esculenta TaxID=3983 RepID=A0ACB7HD90_MANES|nr:hypothetical protein MANES_07G044715v8 [Manihot esculenta]
MHEVQVGVAFHRVFLLQLAGKDISIEDEYPFSEKVLIVFLENQLSNS